MIKFISCLTLALLLISCNSDTKEPAPENETSQPDKEVSQSLKYDQIEILLFNTPAMSNKFRIGESMEMNIIDVKGLIARDGQYDLGISMTTVKETGDTVTHVDDIMEIQPLHIPATEQVNIPLYFEFHKPYEANTVYIIHIKIWDKIGGKFVDIEKVIEILPPQKNGFIEVGGNIELDYTVVYKNGKPYTGNTFDTTDLVKVRWALDEVFLQDEPAVKSSMEVMNYKGSIIFQDSESATLTEDAPYFANRFVLSPSRFSEGTYVYRQYLESVGDKQYLEITFPFEISHEKENELN